MKTKKDILEEFNKKASVFILGIEDVNDWLSTVIEELVASVPDFDTTNLKKDDVVMINCEAVTQWKNNILNK